MENSPRRVLSLSAGAGGGALPPALVPFLPTLPAQFTVHRERASADPDEQVRQTVVQMAQEVRQAVGDPAVRSAVADALMGLRPGAPDQTRAGAIYWWVKGHVRLASDPPDDELLISPPVLLAMTSPAGDCDDFSMLTAAMLEAAGIPWEFVVVAADPGDPGRFTHVYVRALVPDGDNGPVIRADRWAS